VKLLKTPSAAPAVYGEWLHATGKPTLLLYAHYDVQKPGDGSQWKSPPFQATVRLGPNGERLYGRGSADNRAGIVIHASAVSQALADAGALPINVKVLIDGEEESGNPHLAKFIQLHRSLLAADALIVPDAMNVDSGIPALITSLRGYVGLRIELKALSKPIHSGIWGGAVPDPSIALAKVLATLVDDNGNVAVPGLEGSDKPAKRNLKEDHALRKQAGLLAGVRLFHWSSRNARLRASALTSLTVNSIQTSAQGHSNNVIADAAWVDLGVRIPYGITPDHAIDLIEKHVKANVPWGLKASFDPGARISPWRGVEPRPFLGAVQKALAQGFGREPVISGFGGTLPIINPLSAALGGAPVIVTGIEDPYSNAHGENESVLLEDFKKAIRSEIDLFRLLSAIDPKDLHPEKRK
jgi:acetylornithine deacetylase/succinyl-diaminopimelate desuccinylase-like protein